VHGLDGGTPDAGELTSRWGAKGRCTHDLALAQRPLAAMPLAFAGLLLLLAGRPGSPPGAAA
jgi:hypothetical protein